MTGLNQCYDDVSENSDDYARHKKREENDKSLNVFSRP